MQYYERVPGVILFRSITDSRRLLVVFIVGETPTAGVHKAALKNALNQIQPACHRETPTAKCEYIFRLLAPSFSGSSESLVNAINSWKTRFLRTKLVIVSGSATVIQKEAFEQKFKNVAPTFDSMVTGDSERLEAFKRFLAERGISSRHTAILTEGNTLLGAEVREAIKKLYIEERKEKTPREESILSLTYPLHISQLRSAAEKARAAAKETFQAPMSRPKNLRLSLEEVGKAKDVVTNVSPFETFSVELVLSNLLATISRENIRYVGISATDVRDQIFLVREIRERAPSAILFTFGADLLYLHSDVNLDFQGMLLVSSYPLFAINQLWANKGIEKARRLQFPDETSQGVYNAAVKLLAYPAKPENLLEYNLPFSGRADKPPLWLTAVGNNDLWPIRMLSGGLESSSSVDAGIFETIGAIYSKPLIFVFMLLNCLSIVLSVTVISGLWASQPSNKSMIKWGQKCRRLELLQDAAFPQHCLERRVYLASLFLLILLFSVVSFSVFTRFVAFAASPSWFWLLVFIFACLALALSFVASVLVVSKIVCTIRCSGTKANAVFQLVRWSIVFFFSVIYSGSCFRSGMASL